MLLILTKLVINVGNILLRCLSVFGIYGRYFLEATLVGDCMSVFIGRKKASLLKSTKLHEAKKVGRVLALMRISII